MKLDHAEIEMILHALISLRANIDLKTIAGTLEAREMSRLIKRLQAEISSLTDS